MYMRLPGYLAATCALLVWVSPLQADGFEGPLQVRNQFPLFMSLGRQYLEGALPEDSLSLSLSHSSVFLFQKAGVRSVDLDMEITELNVRIKQRVFSYMEIEVGVPFLTMGPGILDPLVDVYHQASGLPDAGRHLFDSYRFRYGFRYTEFEAIDARPGRLAHGDAVVGTKLLLWRIRNTRSLAIRWDLELPTGNPNIGYGNGKRDYGLRLIYEEVLSPNWKLYGNLGITDPGDMDGNKRLSTYRYVQGGLGLEWLVDDRHSLLVQGLYATSPYPHTRIPEIDRAGVLLSLGWRIRRQGSHWEFSFSEDANTAAAPDFTLNLSYKRGFSLFGSEG